MRIGITFVNPMIYWNHNKMNVFWCWIFWLFVGQTTIYRTYNFRLLGINISFAKKDKYLIWWHSLKNILNKDMYDYMWTKLDDKHGDYYDNIKRLYSIYCNPCIKTMIAIDKIEDLK